MLKLFRKLTAVTLAGALSLSMAAVSAGAAGGNQLVEVDLWNAISNQASMGNVATDNNPQALYNPAENTLQIATNPVNVSGYMSGITEAQYDTTGSGDYSAVTTLSTMQVDTGTKNDGTNHTITVLTSFEIELPDYIQKSGVEYIPVQFIVPYTPMDVAVGEGFLDARLRIDWSTTEDTDMSEIVPNTEMSSGGVVDVDLKDAATGVELSADSNKVNVDATLSAELVTSGADYEKAKSALGSSEFDLYRIRLMVNNADTTLSGTAELKFPYSGDLEMYRINDDGTKTVLRGTAGQDGYSVMTTRIGLFAVVGGSKINSGTTSTDSDTFTDISSHWAREYILRATNEGLFNGTSETTFSPEAQMTDGMVITVLYRMAGQPDVTVSTMPNVTPGMYYEKACAWGYANNIIGGYTAFDPERNVTREELATMLYRYYSLTGTPVAGADLSAYSDASSVSDWAQAGVAWANAAGIVNGTSETTLSPSNNATRAEVATMLCRYLDYTA